MSDTPPWPREAALVQTIGRGSPGAERLDLIETPAGSSRRGGPRMSAIVFITSLLLLSASLPALASVLRTRLPAARRHPVELEPVEFGVTQKARRSPRHAVLLHRGLMASFFTALVALLLLPASARLADVGVGLIPIALAVALPSMWVSLHARSRSRDDRLRLAGRETYGGRAA